MPDDPRTNDLPKRPEVLRAPKGLFEEASLLDKAIRYAEKSPGLVDERILEAMRRSEGLITTINSGIAFAVTVVADYESQGTDVEQPHTGEIGED